VEHNRPPDTRRRKKEAALPKEVGGISGSFLGKGAREELNTEGRGIFEGKPT